MSPDSAASLSNSHISGSKPSAFHFNLQICNNVRGDCERVANMDFCVPISISFYCTLNNPTLTMIYDKGSTSKEPSVEKPKNRLLAFPLLSLTSSWTKFKNIICHHIIEPRIKSMIVDPDYWSRWSPSHLWSSVEWIALETHNILAQFSPYIF